MTKRKTATPKRKTATRKRKLKVLTIQRSKWRCGGSEHISAHEAGRRGAGVSRLLNDEGFMCCLGFDAVACGLPPTRILGVIDPESMATVSPLSVQPPLPVRYIRRRLVKSAYSWRTYDNSPIIRRAMVINDDEGLTHAQRERKLRPVLKELGYDRVRFVD